MKRNYQRLDRELIILALGAFALFFGALLFVALLFLLFGSLMVLLSVIFHKQLYRIRSYRKAKENNGDERDQCYCLEEGENPI